MDFYYQLFNLIVLFLFVIIAIIFSAISRKILPVIPAFFVSIIVYIITTNGFLAGISLLLVTSILQLKSY
jgi:hypothetical protein